MLNINLFITSTLSTSYSYLINNDALTAKPLMAIVIIILIITIPVYRLSRRLVDAHAP